MLTFKLNVCQFGFVNFQHAVIVWSDGMFSF